jgi:spermidine synthase
MTIDPVGLASEVSTAGELERELLDYFERSVGCDAAFLGLRGSPATSFGLDATRLARALCPGSPYERELLPVKAAALQARGVAVDTNVLGVLEVRKAAYFRYLAAPVGGTHSLMGYLVLRGRVIGALMLGRTGRSFARREVELVEQLLGPTVIARASFGLPGLVSSPLPAVRSRLVDWPWGDRTIARRISGKNELTVRDRRGHREMVARDLERGGEMVWSRASLSDPARSGWPYVDLFHVAATLARRRDRALFIGCGGAVGPRQFATTYPGVELDVVEPDPGVIALARSLFALDDIPNLRVHEADGISFLENAEPCSWDVVIVDAYDADALAGGFSARGVMASIRAALRSGGTMAFNVVGALDGAGPVRSVVRAAASALTDVRVLPVMVPDEAYASSTVRNVVVVGSKKP